MYKSTWKRINEKRRIKLLHLQRAKDESLKHKNVGTVKPTFSWNFKSPFVYEQKEATNQNSSNVDWRPNQTKQVERWKEEQIIIMYEVSEHCNKENGMWNEMR